MFEIFTFRKWRQTRESSYCFFPSCFCISAEEEYKRLSEALADEGSYNAVAFKYSADYYDPSQPTEEEDANKETGESSVRQMLTCVELSVS